MQIKITQKGTLQKNIKLYNNKDKDGKAVEDKAISKI